MSIRVLTEDDATDFQALRLRGVQDHPEAYGVSFEEERDTPIEKVIERLRDSSPERFILGAWKNNELVGLAGFSRHAHLKTRHKAIIWGMYVAPEVRGQGLARALLNEIITRARLVPALEELILAVTVGNHRARRLYLDIGFEPYSVEPRYIKLDDQYFDIEWMLLRL